MSNFNFGTSILPTSDNTFSLGSASKRWKINDQEITFDTIYPIGAVYISVTECNPEQLFGGTWEQITGRFLLACDTTYTNGSTGGSATMAHTHTMTHTHTQVATTSGGPSNNTSGGPSNNTSGGNNGATAGPSNNTSGSTAITIAQMPSHNHGSAGAHRHTWGWFKGPDSVERSYQNTTQWTKYAQSNDAVMNEAGAHTHTSQGSGSGHTHTLSSHTHTMSSHTHTLSSHTHTLSSHTHSIAATTTGAASNATTSAASNNNNMPPYLAVYMYKRIA